MRQRPVNGFGCFDFLGMAQRTFLIAFVTSNASGSHGGTFFAAGSSFRPGRMAQAAGGGSLSAYCVPQVVQMKFGMAYHPLGNPHMPGVTSSTKFPAGSRK